MSRAGKCGAPRIPRRGTRDQYLKVTPTVARV
jgi:hypothetical protein